MKHLAVIVVALATPACTTLGPMPASTTVSAVPANRPGFEAQVGVVPGFMLSDATHEARGAALGQVSGLIEPDRWLGLKGLVVGARQVGNDGNTIFEPFAGLRRQIDEHFALAGIVYGTHASGGDQYASYDATRVGAELAGDVNLASNSWIGLHAQASISATSIDASGHYCENAEGRGTDCNADGMDRYVDATLSGVYATATTGLSLDLFRRPEGTVHSVRLAGMMTFGSMPRVRNGEQEKGDAYVAGGLTLTVGLGQ